MVCESSLIIFLGDGRQSSGRVEKYTRLVDFEGHSPECHVLSKFGLPQCNMH